MLSALQLQKLYVDRNVAADKLASVTVVADKRCDEWRRLVTPAAGEGGVYCGVSRDVACLSDVCDDGSAVLELQTAVAAACAGLGVTVKW